MTSYIMIVLSIAAIICIFIVIAIVLNKIFKRLKALEDGFVSEDSIWFLLRRYYVNLSDFRISEEAELRDYLHRKPGQTPIKVRFAEKVVDKTRNEYNIYQKTKKARRIAGTDQLTSKSIP